LSKNKYPIRRTIKRAVLGLLGLLVICIISGFFYVRSHLKTVIQELVKRETHNTYKIDFSELVLGLRQGKLELKDATLSPTTGISESFYNIRIPALSLAVSSWRPFLFSGKIEVDSLTIDGPVINIYHEPATNNRSGKKFEMSRFYENLKKATAKIGVHALNITGGVLALHEKGYPKPLTISNIDLSIREFSDEKRTKDQFLSASRFILKVRDQQWELSPGHNIHFKNLFFSGNDLQVDSCAIHLQTDSSASATSFHANKLLFRMNNPSSFYEQELLQVDTLYCQSPVLNLGLAKKNGERHKEKKKGLDEILEKLFGPIDLHYVNIEKGRIEMNMEAGNSSSYASTQTDLKIYDLNIDPKRTPHVQVEKIDLRLNEIKFATPDSLYFLNIKEFGFLGNDLIAKNANFSPTEKNDRNLELNVEVPLFKLSDISLIDLLQKKFVASEAWIGNPHIVLNSKGKKQQKPVVSIDTAATAGEEDDDDEEEEDEKTGVKNIYETLKAIAQLVQVDILYINKGELEYNINSGTRVKMKLSDFDLQLMVNELLQSTSPLAIKKSVPHLRVGAGALHSGQTDLKFKNMLVTGVRQLGSLGSAELHSGQGLAVRAYDIFWEKFSWDSLVEKNRLVLDSLDISRFRIVSTQRTNMGAAKKKTGIPVHIRKLNSNNFDLSLVSQNANSKASGKGRSLHISGLTAENGQVSWAGLQTSLNDIILENPNSRLSLEEADLHMGKESSIRGLHFTNRLATVSVPRITLGLAVFNTDISRLHLSHLRVHEPDIVVHKNSSEPTAGERARSAGSLTLLLSSFSISNGNIRYSDQKNEGSAKLNVNGETFRFQKGSPDQLSYHTLHADLRDIRYRSAGLPLTLDDLKLTLNEGHITSNHNGHTKIVSNVSASWQALNFSQTGKKNSQLLVKDVSGNLGHYVLNFEKGQKISIPAIIERTSIEKGSMRYSDSNQVMNIAGIKANAAKGSIELDDISLRPVIEREQFFKTSSFQKDYLVLKIDKLLISDLKTQRLLNDTILNIRKVIAGNAFISSARDKNIAFLHGIEKHMPTKLISKLGMPVKVDTIELKNASVNVHEISNTTKKEGIIPLTEINGLITNFTNNKAETDSLHIQATGKVLNYNIRRFRYAESYSDSLSGFRMSYRLSPMELTDLTRVTVPLVSVSVVSGKADTLYARLSGNKHGAYGEMNFYYKQLKIRIMDKKDSLKKGFLLAFENLLANKLILKNKNRKHSRLFFLRNKEKFVFNYWVKTMFSGIFTSAGVKKNRKYKKMYDAYKDRYSLPI
jgi:hypothetical protein